MIRKTILFLTAILLTVMLICACAGKKEAIDWVGEYFGTTPAADAPGIDTTLILNADFTYSITYDFIDREDAFTDTGTFTFNEAGNTISLPGYSIPHYYKIGKNFVQMLDLAGNEIEGEFADMYILKKK